MIKQIESKVVNRLRQVTSAIKQEGANQVSIISSTAERQAAIELAKAAALKPQIVGQAFHKTCEDPELAEILFTILDPERMRLSDTSVTLIPKGQHLLAHLMAAQGRVGVTHESARGRAGQLRRHPAEGKVRSWAASPGSR